MNDDESKEKLEHALNNISSAIELNLENIYGKKMGYVLITAEFHKNLKQIAGNCTERDCMKWVLESASELASDSKNPTMHLDFMTATAIILIKEGHVDTLQHWLNITVAAAKSFSNNDKKDKLN